MSGPPPKKSLGQHFLADDNILGVISRLAELGPADIVLEIGPGLGTLTRVLADKCAHVHAVELDGRLEPHLRVRRRQGQRLAPLGRRLAARSRRTGATGDQARREPALQHRHPDRRGEPRRPSDDRALVRDGAARGRRSLLRRPLDEGIRRRLRVDPARDGADGIPPCLPLRLPPPAERRLRSRRLPPAPASRELRQNPARRRGGVRPPSQDARELPPALRRRDPGGGGCGAHRARARRGRACRGAAATRVPRAGRGCSHDQRRRAREDQPRARRRASARGRQARGLDRLAADCAARPHPRIARPGPDGDRVRRHHRRRRRSRRSP